LRWHLVAVRCLWSLARASHLHQFKAEFPPNKRRCALERFDCHVALGLENAINLSSACMQSVGHLRFGDALLAHLLGKLPGNHAQSRFR